MLWILQTLCVFLFILLKICRLNRLILTHTHKFLSESSQCISSLNQVVSNFTGRVIEWYRFKMGFRQHRPPPKGVWVTKYRSFFKMSLNLHCTLECHSRKFFFYVLLGKTKMATVACHRFLSDDTRETRLKMFMSDHCMARSKFGLPLR